MSNFNERTVERLNDLLKKANDARDGFEKASEHVENPKLKKFFKEKASERRLYINELTTTLKKKGMDVEENSGSLEGSLHRAWIDTRAIFSLDDDEAMLEEVRNGEKAAVEDYEDVLERCEFDATIRGILVEQKNSIKNSYLKVDYLEKVQ